MKQNTIGILVTINTIILLAFLIGAIILYLNLRPAINLVGSISDPIRDVKGRIRRSVDRWDRMGDQAVSNLERLQEGGIEKLDQLGQRVSGLINNFNENQ